MKRFILCCDDGRWINIEAENWMEAIRQTIAACCSDVVVYVFEQDSDCAE